MCTAYTIAGTKWKNWWYFGEAKYHTNKTKKCCSYGNFINNCFFVAFNKFNAKPMWKTLKARWQRCKHKELAAVSLSILIHSKLIGVPFAAAAAVHFLFGQTPSVQHRNRSFVVFRFVCSWEMLPFFCSFVRSFVVQQHTHTHNTRHDIVVVEDSKGRCTLPHATHNKVVQCALACNSNNSTARVWSGYVMKV